MAKMDTDIVVEVKAKLNINEDTAQTCLKMVELYANENGMKIIAQDVGDGKVRLHFERW